MTLKEIVLKNSNKPFEELVAIANKAGHSKTQLIKKASALRREGNKIPLFKASAEKVTPPKEAPEFKAKGIKLSDLKKKYSLSEVIKSYLSSLGAGEVVDEREMMEDIDIKKWSNYRMILNSPEMEAYRGKIRDSVYWGMPKTIQSGKEDGTLRNIKY